MGQLHELTEPFTLLMYQRARPGPVRMFTAKSGTRGRLLLEWRPAARAQFYRIERTREGRDYVLLDETRETFFYLVNIPLHDKWFYRVVAVNSRGAGKAKLVWFFERRATGLAA